MNVARPRKPYREGCEPDKCVRALGWLGKVVECREDAGLYDERGHFGKVGPVVDYGPREFGWFRFIDEAHPMGILTHSSEVYPPQGQNLKSEIPNLKS